MAPKSDALARASRSPSNMPEERGPRAAGRPDARASCRCLTRGSSHSHIAASAELAPGAVEHDARGRGAAAYQRGDLESVPAAADLGAARRGCVAAAGLRVC